MFSNKFLRFCNLALGEREESSWQQCGGSWEQFNGMVPDSVSRQPLRLFFAKHLFVPLVLEGNPSNGGCRDRFWVEDNPSNEIVVWALLLRDVLLLVHKDCFLCIVGPQYHWELGMVDPSSLPVYFWLSCSEPWITEDCFLFSKFCEIESKVGVISPCLDLEVGVKAELSTFVF